MKFCGHDLYINPTEESLQVDAVRARGRTGRFLTMQELLPLLCDPVTKQPLALSGEELVGPNGRYPLTASGPQLFPCDPQRLVAALSGPNALHEFPSLTPIEQYCAYGLLKASSNNNNLDFTDVWYGRHLWRARQILQPARGTFLDVGCDDAFLSRGMLDPSVAYVGLEPSSGNSPVVRVGGLGEFLPFAAASFDGVGFQTSLDHVFDYHLALGEARRVLRPGGTLYLATLLWTDHAHLYTDTVHFHHFRPAQIEAALAEGFEVKEVHAYPWKNNTHRFGVYLRATRT